MTENVQRQYVHLRKRRIMEYLKNAPAALDPFEDNKEEVIEPFEDNNKEEVIEMPKLERKLLSQDEQLEKTIEDTTNSTLSREEKQIFLRKYLNQNIEGGLDKFVASMENKDFTLEELGCEKFLLERILMEPTSPNIDETLPNIEEEEEHEQIEKAETEEEEEEALQALDMKITRAENRENKKFYYLEKILRELKKRMKGENAVTENCNVDSKNNIKKYRAKLQKFLTSKELKILDIKPMDVVFDLQPRTPKRKIKHSSRLSISATSKPIVKKLKTEKISKAAKVFEATSDGMVVIGPNGTEIALEALQSINWSLSGPAITRKILVGVFKRETLAFHSLTGKPSPAFMDCDKPLKKQLDQRKIEDILNFVMQNTQISEQEIKNAIITKCADENKMYRQREKKRLFDALKLQKKSKKLP